MQWVDCAAHALIYTLAHVSRVQTQAELTPLSVRGPRCHSASMVALSRLPPNPTITSTVSMARRGNWTMQQYPFTTRSNNALPGTVQYKGKTCHLLVGVCDIGDDGPGLDLWHALFECAVTQGHPTQSVVDARNSFHSCVTRLDKRGRCQRQQHERFSKRRGRPP